MLARDLSALIWHNGTVRAVWVAGSPAVVGGRRLSFKEPWGVTVDRAGTVYVTDRGNERLQILSSTGEPLAQRLLGPSIRGVAVDQRGNAYITAGDHVLAVTPSSAQRPTVWR